jgi:hypothetical protein
VSDLSRDFTADLSVRNDGTGRTIEGIVVPFGVTARVSDGGPFYDEQFQRGAFTKTLSERRSPVKLLNQHDSRNPIGRAVEMREDGAGLFGAFRIANVNAGNEALELAREDILNSFSVGFKPVKHRMAGQTKVRTEVGLQEVSMVTFPAYADAMVAGIRSDLSPSDAGLLQLILSNLAAGDAALDPIVDALTKTDDALDQAQAVLAMMLGVPNPDPPDDDDDDSSDPADMTDLAVMMNGPRGGDYLARLNSLSARLASARRVAATPSGAGVGKPTLSGHLARYTNLRAYARKNGCL